MSEAIDEAAMRLAIDQARGRNRGDAERRQVVGQLGLDLGNALRVQCDWLRKLIGEDWPTYPDYSLVTMQGTADKNPDMMVALGRGTAKAALFAIEEAFEARGERHERGYSFSDRAQHFPPKIEAAFRAALPATTAVVATPAGASAGASRWAGASPRICAPTPRHPLPEPCHVRSRCCPTQGGNPLLHPVPLVAARCLDGAGAADHV